MTIMALTISLTSAVKNNYYKALYFYNSKKNKQKVLNLNNGIKGKIFFIISESLSMEGLILFKLIEVSVPLSEKIILISIILYIIGNLMVILIKLYQNSYKDGSISKV